MDSRLIQAIERLRKLENAPRPGYGHPYEYQMWAGGWYVNARAITEDRQLVVDYVLKVPDSKLEELFG